MDNEKFRTHTHTHTRSRTQQCTSAFQAPAADSLLEKKAFAHITHNTHTPNPDASNMRPVRKQNLTQNNTNYAHQYLFVLLGSANADAYTHVPGAKVTRKDTSAQAAALSQHTIHLLEPFPPPSSYTSIPKIYQIHQTAERPHTYV